MVEIGGDLVQEIVLKIMVGNLIMVLQILIFAIE